MSVKFSQDEYMKKINSIYESPNIDILEWNGYTQSITYYCYKCGETHKNCNARGLFSRYSYCDYENLSKVKKYWAKKDFLSRLQRLHQCEIDVIEYKGPSSPLVYRCLICGEIKTIPHARDALQRLSLCNNCDGTEKDKTRKKINEIFYNNPNYKLISYRGANDKAKIQCLKCGAFFERRPQNIIQSPDSCPNCNNGGTKQMLSLEEVQKRLDESFDKDEYTILEYRGQLDKHSKIQCNKCGLIFETQMSVFPTTRGCPRCNRYESKGERLVEKYFQQNDITYERQKRFLDCNHRMSSFDFCVYDKNDQMNLIEVNGRQHYYNVEHWDGLELVQRRDALKANYCQEHNIPLIIIPYTDLEMAKLDKYLGFLKGSTTIAEASNQATVLDEMNNT